MKFSKNVTSQPRKKRKAAIHAGIHKWKRKLRVHLSRELRQKMKKRALPAKKGDKVKVLRGEFRKREGKITEVDVKRGRIFIEGLVQKKQGGKEVFVPVDPSNCVLLEWQEPKRKVRKQRVKPKPSQPQAKNMQPQAKPPQPQTKVVQAAPKIVQLKPEATQPGAMVGKKPESHSSQTISQKA